MSTTRIVNFVCIRMLLTDNWCISYANNLIGQLFIIIIWVEQTFFLCIIYWSVTGANLEIKQQTFDERIRLGRCLLVNCWKEWWMEQKNFTWTSWILLEISGCPKRSPSNQWNGYCNKNNVKVLISRHLHGKKTQP